MMPEITSHEALLREIENATQKARAWYDAIPADQFFVRQAESWSASDNVDHLIRAIRPVTLALKLPKAGLQLVFGKGEKSRSYEEICRVYEEAIARGGRASGVYLPAQSSPADPQGEKEKLLAQLTKSSDGLRSALQKWNEAQLDQYQLPHPLLGNLTVREMLFFSIYHMLRHARPEGD